MRTSCGCVAPLVWASAPGSTMAKDSSTVAEPMLWECIMRALQPDRFPVNWDRRRGSRSPRIVRSIMRDRTAVAVMAALIVPAIHAQDVPDWQTKAGGKMTFEVASVKPTRGQAGPPSFPINVGEAYRPTGGYFRADFPL